MSQKAADLERVWHAWASRQARPHLLRFSKERQKQIGKALAVGYTADDLITLIAFAYDSDHERAKFWRGDNDSGATYLDLTNLLRVSKLDERVIWALEWREDETGEDEGGGSHPPPQPTLLRALTTSPPKRSPTVAPGDVAPGDESAPPRFRGSIRS